MQSKIIGVRFTKIGKVYHFDAKSIPDLKIGDHVITDTARGKHLGEVVALVEKPDANQKNRYKKVLRRATSRDLLLQQVWKNKEIAAMIDCRERASQLKLKNVKIVAAQFNYDGSHLTFLYNTGEEEKSSLKSLGQDMGKKYASSKIEMRQVGPRDVAKILGGMGACGLEKRCCSQFLTEFSPISIKMAKAQGISLAPSEITGMCGRLPCCLLYEYEAYAAARKKLPNRKKRVVTPQGEGKVLDVLPLTDTVVVQLNGEERGVRHSFHRDEIEPWNEREALRRKAAEPCNNGEGCNCGRHAQPKPAQEQEP
ncbi:MAG: hypothetical protein L3J16_06925 [Anaerolineales bacterium]|nr:hypothetical protein [Anaerolineales bacterium]